MACNCKDMKGFALTMYKAKAFENKTEKKAAVFVVGDSVSFTEKKNVKKVKGICCYFTTDGVEHKISRPKTKKVPKKQEEKAG